jgi:hypothetical protein
MSAFVAGWSRDRLGTNARRGSVHDVAGTSSAPTGAWMRCCGRSVLRSELRSRSGTVAADPQLVSIRSRKMFTRAGLSRSAKAAGCLVDANRPMSLLSQGRAGR